MKSRLLRRIAAEERRQRQDAKREERRLRKEQRRRARLEDSAGHLPRHPPTTGRFDMTDPTPPSNPASAPGAGPVVPGSRVRVRDAEGEHEHTVVERLTSAAPPGCVSVASPVGRALLGRRPGEQVQVPTPDGIRVLTIVAVTPPHSGVPGDSGH
jgi:transcription elongation factor GreA